MPQGLHENCNRSFDGPGGEYAHTNLSSIHIDDDETYSADLNHPTNMPLILVLLHEIGHVLGLGHLENADSVMHAYIDSITERSVLNLASLPYLTAINLVFVRLPCECP